MARFRPYLPCHAIGNLAVQANLHRGVALWVCWDRDWPPELCRHAEAVRNQRLDGLRRGNGGRKTAFAYGMRAEHTPKSGQITPATTAPH